MSYLLGIIAVALTISVYVFRRPAIGIASALCWVIFGWHAYTLSTGVDIYYALFWLGIILGVVVVMESIILRPRAEEPEEKIDEDEEWDDYEKRYGRIEGRIKKRQALTHRARRA